MRSLLLPLLATILTLALLVPPGQLFFAAFKKWRLAILESSKAAFRLTMAVAAFSLLFNFAYALSLFIASGPTQIDANWALAIALALAWGTFWGHQALRRYGRERRSMQY